jgi:hypothetical protein
MKMTKREKILAIYFYLEGVHQENHPDLIGDNGFLARATIDKFGKNLENVIRSFVEDMTVENLENEVSAAASSTL